MEELKKVAVLENEIESQLVEPILREMGIPFLIKSYHDAAYDGIFVLQNGWGAIYAPASAEQEIKEILAELRDKTISE